MLLRLWAAIILGNALALAQSSPYNASARWGIAFTTLSNKLYIHGGKTDPNNQYSYTSAPNTNDLLALDLSSSFSLDRPPWVLLSGAEIPDDLQGPAIAFHTITAYSDDAVLVFGGDAGPSLPISTNADSAWLLTSLSPQKGGSSPTASTVKWTNETLGWANEPIRRIYHSASGVYGNVWIIGGSKDDGSTDTFNEAWCFNPGSVSSSPSFSLITPSGGIGLNGILGHASILLVNGTLIVFGGWSSSQNGLLPLSSIWMIDTQTPGAGWTVATLSGSAPQPRRNFAFALLDGNKIIIHGGADAALELLFSDGWIADLNSMTWSEAPAMAAGLGQRFGHFAVGLGSQAMFGFGRGANGPANPGPYVYDVSAGAFVATYTPSPTNTLGNPPGHPAHTSSFPSSSNVQSTSTNTHSTIIPSSSYSSTVSMVTYTSTNFEGKGYTSILSATVPATPAPPSSSTGGSGDLGKHNGKIIGIAVGTVVGGMTLALASAAAIFILVERRRRTNAGWGTVGGDDYDPDARAGAAGVRSGLVWTAGNEHGHDEDPERDINASGAASTASEPTNEKGGAPPIVGGWSHMPQRRKSGAWAALGVGRSPLRRGAYRGPGAAPAQARFDMLADEDERVFDFGNLGPYVGRRSELSRNTTVTSNNSARSAGAAMGLPWFRRTASSRSWTEVMNDGVSGVKALGRSISGSAAGHPAIGSDWWEKHPDFLDAEAGLLTDDEISQRATAVNAAEEAEGVQNNEISVVLVSNAARMRGGAPSDVLTSHSQASSYYQDPFTSGPDDAVTIAPLLALDRESSDGTSALPRATRNYTTAPAPPPPAAAVIPHHSHQASGFEGAGSSTGPGTATYQAAFLPLIRPPSSSTVVSTADRGPQSDQSHGSGVGCSSDSLGTVAGRSSADTLPTVISSAPTSAPVRRSNSWWSRFSALPLRGPGSSETGVTSPTGSTRRMSFRLPGSLTSVALDPKYAIDFRDPNPPPALPRLHAIEESGNSPDGSPESPEQHSKERSNVTNSSTGEGVAGLGVGAVGLARKRMMQSSYPHVTAARSSASLKTTKTADSDIAEKMAIGHYHAVQRAGTPSHHEPSNSEPGSMSSAQAFERDNAADELGDLAFATSPTVMSPADNRNPMPRPLPPLPRAKQTLAATGVAARIAEFERRATLNQPGLAILGGPRLPPSPASTAAERREKRRQTAPPENTETQVTKVRWSVAERPPLFVANPDTRRRDGTEDSRSTSG